MGKCKSLDLDVVAGSTTQVIARWLTSQNASYVDHFEIQFMYYNGKSIKWVYESVKNVATTARSTKAGKGEFWYATYTCPDPSDEKATKIKYRVRAKAKQYTYTVETTDSKGNKKTEKRTAYRFGGANGYDDWVTLSGDIDNPRLSAAKKEAAAAPPVPPVPTAEISPKNDRVVFISTSLSTDLAAVVELYMQINLGTGYVNTFIGEAKKGDVVTFFAVGAGASARFRARSRNKSSGKLSSYSAYSNMVYTEPKPPKNVKTEAVRRQVGTEFKCDSIRVTWENEGASGEAAEVQWCADGAFTPGGTESATVEGAEENSFIITDIDTSDSNKWHVRVRRKHGDMYSAWKSGGESVVGTTPGAPTTYATAGAVPLEEQVRLSWTHNNADKSEQTAALVEVMVSGNTISKNVTGAAQYVLVTPSECGAVDGSELSWRVCTSGATGIPGPFSGWRSFKAYTQPELIVSAVDGSGASVSGGRGMTALPLGVTARAANTNAEATAWTARLECVDDFERTRPDGTSETVAAGTAIWRGTSDGGSSATFSIGPEAGIVSGVAMALRVSASFSNGLRASSVLAFSAAWAGGIPSPSARARSDDGLTATIWPVCERLDGNGNAIPRSSGGNPVYYDDEGLWRAYELQPGVELSVYRIDAYGDPQLVMDGIANDGASAVIDPHPNFGDCVYRVVAMSTATGECEYEDFACAVENRALVVQWDETWGEGEDGGRVYTGGMLTLPGNIKENMSTEPDVALAEFYGDKYPTSRYGTQQHARATWSADFALAYDPELMQALWRLQNHFGDCYVREPSGVGYWANVKAAYETAGAIVSVSLDVTRVKRAGGDAL